MDSPSGRRSSNGKSSRAATNSPQSSVFYTSCHRCGALPAAYSGLRRFTNNNARKVRPVPARRAPVISILASAARKASAKPTMARKIAAKSCKTTKMSRTRDLHDSARKVSSIVAHVTTRPGLQQFPTRIHLKKPAFWILANRINLAGHLLGVGGSHVPHSF